MPFAPSPIMIRYGDSGVLGQAAAQLGSNLGIMQNLALARQRQSQDLQFVNDDMNRQAAYTDNANKLQLAHSMMLQQQQGSTPSSSLNASGPMVDSILAAKRLVRSSQLGNATLSPEQQQSISTLENNPQIGVPEYEGVIRGMASGFENQYRQGKDAEAKALKQSELDQSLKDKQSILDAAKTQIAPEDAEILKGYASDHRFSANDLRIAVQHSAGKQQMKAAQTVSQQEKAHLFQAAANALLPEDQQQLQPLVADPKVSTQQMHQAIVQLHQKAVQAEKEKQAHALNVMRLSAAGLRSEVAKMEKNPYIDFSQGPEQFTTKGNDGKPVVDNANLAVYQQWQAKKQALDALDAKVNSEAARSDQPIQNEDLSKLSDDEILKRLNQ